VRVLHVIPSIARSAGGPSEVVRELLPQLEHQGISVRLVTTTKGAIASDRDVLRKRNVRSARSYLSRWTFAPGLIPILWKEISHADLVHVHSVHTFPSTLAMLVARLRGRPVVLQPHGALNRYHIAQRRALKLAYLRFVDRFGLGSVRTVLYSSQIEISEGQAILPRVDVGVLALGIEERILGLPREESVPPRILFLARLAKKKRLDILLRALASLTLADASFDAVIAGPIDADLDFDPDRMIAELGLKSTRRIGQVNAAERAELLSTASIFVLPSDDESFGISAAEAMGAGCAVVCSPFVGVANDARGAGAAETVEQDPERLAEALLMLLNNADARALLGVRARRYASRNLTWSNISENLVRYYTNALRPAT